MRSRPRGKQKILGILKNSDDKAAREFVETDKTFSKISDACEDTVENLNECVRQSLYLGSEFQYSNGLSLFFPWSYISFIMSKSQYLSRDFAIGSKKRGKEKTAELSGWTSFLETYLSKTLRKVRHSSDEEFFLFDLNSSNIAKDENDIFKLNTPFDRLNTSFGDRLNTSFGDRLSSVMNNFGRVKNFPWSPKLWQPTEGLFDDED